MHEMAVTKDILDIVLKYAAANNAKQVLGVGLKIGELRDVVDDYMQRFFNYLSRDTIADGAKLKIEHAPIIFRCSCGETFQVSIKRVMSSKPTICPYCSGRNAVLNSGQEFEIIGIEVI